MGGRHGVEFTRAARRDGWIDEDADRLDPAVSCAVRPTQDKTLAVTQVSGGSQSLYAVNQMRVLGQCPHISQHDIVTNHVRDGMLAP